MDKSRTRASLFLSHLPAGTKVPADLEEQLGDLLDAGCAAWPDLALGEDVFLRRLAVHAEGARALLPDPAHAGDLYLACACAHGVPRAIEAFDHAFAKDIARALGRVDSSKAFIDDALQTFREKLLVPRGGALPKIAEYAGRAALRSWLQAGAVRTALDLRRGKVDRGHDELRSDVRTMGAAPDPELAYLKTKYKKEFEEAISGAVRGLEDKERTILRLHFVDGLGVDGLGALYRTSRSTAGRWLVSAQQALHQGMRRELESRLRLTPSELDSLAGLVRSQLELSLPGLLGRA